jgi:predicted DNA-binding protein (UPF0251 family)
LTVTLDEFEAVRLADYEGLYQEDGARRMKISRATFGRILAGAHRKIAECLVKGKALRIEIARQPEEETVTRCHKSKRTNVAASLSPGA